MLYIVFQKTTILSYKTVNVVLLTIDDKY